MGTRPTGTVTFLFTDIEGSTELWRDSPDAMKSALARHDDVMREAFEALGGYVFSTGGDGFAVAFARTSDAVEAARRTQSRLAAESRAGEMPLKVRMGIHTGEVHERDGDYFGLPVSVASRLMSLGDGGHVLLSGLAAELVANQAKLVDLGEHPIRGLNEPIRVHALDEPGLCTRPLSTGRSVDEPHRYRFADVEIDVAGRVVRRGGGVIPIEPEEFDLLLYLVENYDRAVTKDELLDAISSDGFVSESVLTSRIKSARRAVGDDGRRQEIIRTVHGRGYQFIATFHDSDAGIVRLGRGSTALPKWARPLIAREREVAALTDMVSYNRLVTVLGPGGVGKTRLATEVARRWEHDHDDVVVMVLLASICDPARFLSAVRDSLGLVPGGYSDGVPAIAEAIGGRPALLVLDNFEHVVDAAPRVAELLAAIPRLHVLSTSRERLRLVDERVFELDPLPTEAAGSHEKLPPAVELFIDAARSAGTDLATTDDNIAEVARICRMFDGLPLAVELAAAQLRYIPLPHLRRHLEARATSVGDDARDRPERQRTLADAISWSHGMLTPGQQGLLSGLSLFIGGWPLDAAAAVAAPEHRKEATQDLLSLVDKSLVRRSNEVVSEPRFTMLHVIREFAKDDAEKYGTLQPLHERHANFLAQRLDRTSIDRWADADDRWVDELNLDFENNTVAMVWSLGGAEPVVGCRIVAGLNFWWYRSGRHGDGRRWVGRALEHLDLLEPLTAAHLHLAAGYLAYADRNLDKCREQFRASLDLARQVGNRRVEAISLCNIGAAAVGLPEHFEDGLATLHKGLSSAREMNETAVLAHGLNVLGELNRTKGDLESAESAYREALELNRKAGDRHHEASNVANIGHVLVAKGDIEGALPCFRSGLELSSRVGSRIMLAWSVSEVALPTLLQGRPEVAARLIGGSDAVFDALGAGRGPADHPVHVRTQADLIEELGLQRFNELEAEGRAMTLEEAVELALEGL